VRRRLAHRQVLRPDRPETERQDARVMRNGSAAVAGPRLPSEIAAARGAIEERLDALFPPAIGLSLVEAAMREAVQGPGKRLRPLLAVLGARDLGWHGPATDVGCALELVHAASLILDDLPSMDDAPTRRGKPAIHVTFGEDVAALAAIALLARAYGLLAAAPGLSPEQRVAAVAILSEAVGPAGLVGGQLEDLRGGAPCADRARAVNDRKTAALFVAAARLACIVARSTDECSARFAEFGRQLGQAFQILDDLLDLEGDPHAMGKPRGQDLGKPTLVRLLGAATGQAQLREQIATAAATLAGLPNGGARVACLLETVFAPPAGREATLPAVAGAGEMPC
jgi:geranylgeranyl diphosphate synthase, type II